MLVNEPRPLVDDPHLARPDHHHHRLPLQRDPVGRQGHHRRAAAPRREPGRVPRPGAQGGQRPQGRGAAGSAIATGRPAGRGSTPRRSPRSRRRSRSTTTPSTLPTMGTGATDMAQIRSKGVQCYGIGPAHRLRGRARRASARTATRSASWSRSCTVSSGSSTTWSWISPARNERGIGARGWGPGTGARENTMRRHAVTLSRCSQGSRGPRSPVPGRCAPVSRAGRRVRRQRRRSSPTIW